MKIPVSVRLPWNHPDLAVASDTALRRKYRLLQSWHREHVLDADYGFHHRDTSTRPVGSLLCEAAVASKPALNFLGNAIVLDYVDQRAPEVVRRCGTLDQHRLRHNTLSSMPSAFTFVGALRSAEDRDQIASSMFGLPHMSVNDVDAEWVPPGICREDLLGDRTALDAVVQFKTQQGARTLVGVETKYTEPLSPKQYYTPRLVEVTRECPWFESEASEVLRNRQTNQLWRDALLTWVAGGDGAHLCVVGLTEDMTLWRAVRMVQSQMVNPDRLIPKA